MVRHKIFGYFQSLPLHTTSRGLSDLIPSSGVSPFTEVVWSIGSFK